MNARELHVQNDQEIHNVAERMSLSWTPEHIANVPTRERALEGLGRALAHWARWDCDAVIRIAYSMLQDANCHTEAGYLYQKLQG